MRKNLKHFPAFQIVTSVFTPAPFVSFCTNAMSHVTKETFKINHYFDCDTKSLIYVMHCKVSRKQYFPDRKKKYVGCTIVRFRRRKEKNSGELSLRL